MHMRSLPRRALLALVCCLIGSLFAACAGQNGGNTQVSTADNSSVGSPPVVLHNPAPDQLTLFLSIQIGGHDQTARDTTSINFDFTSNNRPVQFAGNEQFACNGKAIDLHKTPAEQQIVDKTSALAGQPLRCTYSAGKASTTLLLTIPRAPRILSSQDGASLARGRNVLVIYDTQGGQLMGIVALTAKSKAIAQISTSVANQATLDTSSFPAGTGTIVLTETLTPSATPITQTGTPFAKLEAGGNGTALISVNWT